MVQKLQTFVWFTNPFLFSASERDYSPVEPGSREKLVRVAGVEPTTFSFGG
jgi:hypothetical protein